MARPKLTEARKCSECDWEESLGDRQKRLIKGLCPLHYQRSYYSNNRPQPLGTCTYPECSKQAIRNKSCEEHVGVPRPVPKEVQAQRVKKWRKKNIDKVNAYERNQRYKKVYGITVEEYDRQLEAQGFMCAICGSETPSNGGRFHVDHDHDTGEVRGLLCGPCNTGIGQLQESRQIMLSAINYLEAGGVWHVA